MVAHAGFGLPKSVRSPPRDIRSTSTPSSLLSYQLMRLSSQSPSASSASSSPRSASSMHSLARCVAASASSSSVWIARSCVSSSWAGSTRSTESPPVGSAVRLASGISAAKTTRRFGNFSSAPEASSVANSRKDARAASRKAVLQLVIPEVQKSRRLGQRNTTPERIGSTPSAKPGARGSPDENAHLELTSSSKMFCTSTIIRSNCW